MKHYDVLTLKQSGRIRPATSIDPFGCSKLQIIGNSFKYSLHGNAAIDVPVYTV
jgi:hypothetical protein